MSELLPPQLVTQLGRPRLLTGWVGASGGVGDRLSKAIGSGMEFADYREYQPGDDARHIDRFVHARSGQHHVRQFHVDQQLHAVLIVDASPSMYVGEPSKYRHALKLAAAFAYVLVAGGDRALLGLTHGNGVMWSPPLGLRHEIPRLTRWLEEVDADGVATFDEIARSIVDKAKRAGMVLVISDWMFDDHQAALRMLRTLGHEVVAVQVIAEEERDPVGLGSGATWLVDTEGAGRLPAVLGETVRQRYREAFEAWQSELRAALQAVEGRHFLTSTTDDVSSLFTQSWRAAGLLR